MKTLETILNDWLSPAGELPPVYLVGGVTRDYFLCRQWKDIDLMCQHAETLARRIAQTRNAVVVPFEKKQDEPCYRIVDLDHRNHFIDIAEMRGTSVDDDLKCRDFTMNAIAIHVADGGRIGTIHDPLKGRKDIENGVIRMVSPQSFESDPLRLLRAFRFSAEIGFQIDPLTLAAAADHADLISQSSSERIWHELLLILKTHHAVEYIRLMDETALLAVIFPEIHAMKECSQNAFHHLNVWDHSMLVLKHLEMILCDLSDFFGMFADEIRENLDRHNRSAILKLTGLFHDIGKPETKQYHEETKRISFYGHDKKGASILENLAVRLRLSVKDQEFMRNLVSEHMHALRLSDSQVKKSTQMKLIRKLKEDFIPLLILSAADVMSTLGPESKEEDRIRHLNWVKDMVSEYYSTIKITMEKSNLITGNDLIKLGMSPGPEMGNIIHQIREAQDIGRIENHEQAMSLAKKLMENLK